MPGAEMLPGFFLFNAAKSHFYNMNAGDSKLRALQASYHPYRV
jgi:hypothetical protein